MLKSFFSLGVSGSMANKETSIPLQGIIIANGCFIIMALAAIFIGAFKSVAYINKIKKSGDPPEFEPISLKEALKFPFEAGGVLMYVYIWVKFLQTEPKYHKQNETCCGYLSLLVTLISIQFLYKLLSPLISALVSPFLCDTPYHLSFTKGDNKGEKHLINTNFTLYDAIAMACCTTVGIWYFLTKHWIANNLFGMTAAITVIKHFHLNRMLIVCVLMSGLVVYDIFWVFATDVMVTVAASLDAPIKLMFPVDILKNSLIPSNNFSMMGVGDIVFPGVIIAFFLRFDLSLKGNSLLYFHTSTVAFLLGMIVTVTVSYSIRDGQPALLYLVPSCLGLPMAVAAAKGDISALFRYEDYPTVA